MGQLWAFALLLVALASHATIVASDIQVEDEWIDGTFLSGSLLDTYFTYSEVVARLKRVAERYPDLVDYEKLGTSRDGNDIPCVIIAHKPQTKEERVGVDLRPSILFTGLTQPREVLAMMETMFLIRTLLTKAKEESIAALLASRRFIFVPIINPDGFERARILQDGDIKEHITKNTARTCGNITQMGVNLGHNWGMMWNSKTTEPGFDDPCNDLFRGPEPFSEPETKAVRDLILRHPLKAAVFFHARSESEHSRLIVPYMYHKSYLKTHREDKKSRLMNKEDLNVYDKITTVMQDALAPEEGKYQYGTAYEIMNKTISGSEIDWTFDEAGIFSLILQIGTKDRSYWPKKEHVASLLEKLVTSLPRKATPKTSIVGHLSVFPIFLGLGLALILLFGFVVARYLGYDNIVGRFRTIMSRLERMYLYSNYTNLSNRVKEEDELEVNFDDLELEGEAVEEDEDEGAERKGQKESDFVCQFYVLNLNLQDKRKTQTLMIKEQESAH
ncbi:hypothetical protein HDU67_006934 [Dinochytrium kinnereticum]|nr:hypothetical protein HDU67_006934 [Dinochytrium kinnereticum]